MFSSAPDPELSCMEKSELFMRSYWRGMVIILVPVIVFCIFTIFKGNTSFPANYQCGLVIAVVSIYWITECMSLTVASFIPIVALPFLGLMSAVDTAFAYVNDMSIMFLGSLFLAFAYELSNVHRRMAYCFISCFGYTHYKLLFGISFVTMFISMWVSNTAATTMMAPVTFSVLRLVEDNGYGAMFFYKDNEKLPTDITICYFCAVTFSATIGGIGSLIGTGTNLAYKGLLETTYPTSHPEQTITFGLFSGFTVPLMLVLFMANYFWFILFYFGWCRPNSSTAKKANIPKAGEVAMKRSILSLRSGFGDQTFFENMVLALFVLAIALFYTRYPHQMKSGWMEETVNYFHISDQESASGPFIRDASAAMAVAGLMFLLPSAMVWVEYFTAETRGALPKKRVVGILDFYRIHNIMPWGFAFLLGAGFALTAASSKNKLSQAMTEWLTKFKFVHRNVVVLLMILIAMLMTNFASNIVVANIMCPFSMQLAEAVSVSPHWLSLICGISASFCFMLPYGTPGNLIAKSAINMPTSKMITVGTGTTIITILTTWIFFVTYAPVVWRNYSVTELPTWVPKKSDA